MNAVEGNSCSALMIACMHGFCDVATEILLRPDCDVNIGRAKQENKEQILAYFLS